LTEPHKGSGLKTILIVDDEEFIRELLGEIIAAEGFKVLEAASGPQAINIFEQQSANINLVLLDVILPDMDGREVYFKLKSIRPDVKIVIISGYSQTTVRQDLVEAGVEGYITKPFEINQVQHLIQSILDS